MKKLNKIIKKIVIILLGLFIMDYGVVKAIENIQLIITPNISENIIKLNWKDNSSTNCDTYKIWGKKKEGEEFQTLSTMNFTNEEEKVKVLNIYPGDGEIITFCNYLGKSFSFPKSASLKKWMEEPNSENEKGYGKGYIDVTPFSIQEFNQNPSNILKNSKGEYQYDIIMFGTWDNNGNKNLSEIAVKETRSFIKTGRGVLFGHDTINWDLGSSTGFIQLAEQANLTYDNQIDYFDGQNTPGNFSPTGISKIQITKSGITNFPWNIGEIGTNLNVPKTHTVSQIPHGEIWMQFYHTKNDLNKLGNFYLTTWNNTGMIQTGHSNCTATEDEQKVLANTLFYLKQITNQKSMIHYFGNDVASPEQVTKGKFETIEDGSKVKFTFEEPKDNGTTYLYYVENLVTKEKSNIQEATITTGIKGYSYLIDNIKETDPGNHVNKTDLEPILLNTINWKKENYIHIKAIDVAGNVGETNYFKLEDKKPPQIELQKNTNGTIRWKISDQESGIDFIQLPDGTSSNLSEGEYCVKKSGIQKFEVYDKAGNLTIEEIVFEIPAKVVIIYRNIETGLTIKEEVIEGVLGDEYHITSHIDTNQYELVKAPEKLDGFMNQQVIEVFYEYKIKDAKVEVFYKNQETGEILESIEILGKIGDHYDTNSKLNEDQYELLEVIGEKVGIMNKEKYSIEYLYKRRKARIEIHYIDEKEQLIKMENMEGLVGEKYQVQATEIPYYHKVETIGEEEGVIKRQGNQIFYKYKKYNMDVEVKSWISDIYVNGIRRNGNIKETKNKILKIDKKEKEKKEEDIKIDYQITVENLGEISTKIGKVENIIPKEIQFNPKENDTYWIEEKGVSGSIYTTFLQEKELLPGESCSLKIRLTVKKNQIGKIANVVKLKEIENEANFEETNLKNNEDKSEIIIGIITGKTVVWFPCVGVIILTISIITYKKYRKK